MRAFYLAIAAAMAMAGTVNAATLHEGTGRAEFSDSWKSPTIVDAGFDRVSGSWSGWNDYDILGFTSLRTGAQTITLSFSPSKPIGLFDLGFAAGGSLHYQLAAPGHSAWEGTQFGSVDMSYWNRKGDFTYSLSFGDDFRGVLYLALYGTHGSLNYTIHAPGNALPRPAPQPAPLPPVDVPAVPALPVTPAQPAPLPLPVDPILSGSENPEQTAGDMYVGDVVQPAPVPLPAGLALLPAGLAALALLRRRRSGALA